MSRQGSLGQKAAYETGVHQHVPRAVEIELDATAVAAAAMMNCGAVQAAISNSEFSIKKENSSLMVAGQS